MRFADPKNDLAFKKVFGDEKHKYILISFLNSVLDFTGDMVIKDVSLANPYQVPRIPELKETILDIKAVNKKGEIFIVEMQKMDLGDFSKRSLYYTSKAYISQLSKGNDYTQLGRVYFIGLVNFNIFANDSFLSRHLIVNQETMTQDLKEFEFTFIELPKFTLPLEECDNIIKKWIYFINNASDLEIIPRSLQTISVFRDAFEIVQQSSWNSKELEVYEYMALKEFDKINALRTAEKKGMERGMEKGIERGARAKSLEIAKNLLNLLDDETIASITGLSVDEVAMLRIST